MSKQNQHKPNVPELRFPEFSGEWEEKRLGDYAYIKGRLGWKGLKQEEYVESGYAHLIASKHIKNGYIMWSSTDQINEFRYKESLEIGLEENDIIFSKDGSLGNPAIIKEMPKPATINSTMMLVRLDKELVSPCFFYQILLSNQFQRLIHLKVSGSSIPHLFQADMKQFKFFSPSLSEQKKIGEFFSKIDRQIELEEKKLALLEEQKKGYMQKIFSQELRFKDENGNEYPKWKEANLEAVLKMKEGLRRGPFGGALKKEIFIEEGYAVYEQANAIYDNQTFRYFIDENKFNEMKNFSVKADDIIMSCSGTIGKLSLIPKNYKEGIINQALIRFRVSEKLNSLYFLYYMKSGMMQRKILKSNPGSAIVNLIPVKDLKKINLKVPSIEEQEKISNFLHNLDSLLAKKIFKIKMMKNRKDSFLQKMFL
ncbi:restriction endonuclease subunit S [Staphylococcus simulans]|uniref:restriction endonuclease subunit S n=1 Tax=Staphylococcus simulans TaxID=1286 RepID=UPI000BBD2039|nr:restriction endonuclease subunit S [Staphylococcus simulans]ATF30472.1 restriction endonuclease subunit S [Staphylococcus simulans]